MNAATQSLLGRYRLVKVLGQGAMGVVYEAVDTRLGRTVAIKTVLRSHMADEAVAAEYAARFEREAQAAARLSHPHVVAVYDFGEHEDISYIVMEFVRGRELNHLFEANEKFTLNETVRIMRELLQALDYAHQHGIVHRDVKPANVMIDGAGHVKLTDFGVARVANANQDRTMPGTLVGTPSYMSPEQILGLAVGSRTDIFAAGVILYQFLTGRRPFSGGGPFGVQRKIVQDDPVPPSKLNPEAPKDFDAIVARSLAKKPEDRYESAAAFAADLDRALESLTHPAPLLDLDLPDNPVGASAPVPTMPPIAPAPGVPAAGLTLREIPLGTETSRPETQPSSLTAPPPPFDPDSTVIMVRPPVPSAMPPPSAAGTHAPAATHATGHAAGQTVARATTTPREGAGMQRAIPGLASPALPPPPFAEAGTQARPATRTNVPPAPPIAGTLSGTIGGATGARPPVPQNLRSFAPAPPPSSRGTFAGTSAGTLGPRLAPAPPTATLTRLSPPPAAPPPRPVQASRLPAFMRHTLGPLIGGVGVAAVGIGIWLLVTRPSLRTTPPPEPPPPTSTTSDGSAAAPPVAATPAPAPAVEPPAPATAATPAPAPAPAPTPAPPPGEAQTPAPPPSSESNYSKPPRRQGTEARPSRPPAPPPEAAAAPAVPPQAKPPRSANEHRCSDLLQRMQLGEPLSPEQTSFFQNRCARP